MIRAGDTLLDRYGVASLIASGGMADVFLAHDRRLQRDVAVKVFRVGADATRFDAETKLLAQLSHENLVSVFDAGEHDGVPFVVLQYVDGQTLASVLRRGPLSIDAARRLAMDVAGALAYIHGRRVVHRDVKPSNILIAGDGRALLGDFGVALLLDATRYTVDGSMIGTAAYLAPEQATGAAVTPAADVYALGLVLIEAVTGSASFGGTFHEVIAAKLARDPAISVVLPAAWVPLLTAMTHRDPNARPTAEAVQRALEGFEGVADTLAATRLLAPGDAETVVDTDLRPGTGNEAFRGLRRAAITVVAAIVLLGTAAAIIFGGDGGGGTPLQDAAATSASTETTAAAPTTSQTSSTPATTGRPSCPSFVDRKEAIEREKKVAEAAYQGDQDQLKRVLEQLEDRKKVVELEKTAAGC